MTTAEKIIATANRLSPELQERLLALAESIATPAVDCRREIVSAIRRLGDDLAAQGEPLLSREEINAEVAKRRAERAL